MQNDSNEGQQLQNLDNQTTSGAPISPFSPEVTPFHNNPKPKMPKKMLSTILVSIGFVLLIAAGTLAYLLLVNKSSGSDIDTTVSKDLLSTLGDSMKSSINDPAQVSSAVEKTYNTLAITKNVKDKIWVTVDDNSQVLNFSSVRNESSPNESDYNSVIGALNTGGLSEMKTSTALSSTYSSSSEVAQYFSSELIVCNLKNSLVSAVKDIPATFSLQVSCANQTDFSKNLEAMNPFIDAYIAKGASDKDLVFRDPVVQDSGTPDYKNANLKISDIDYSDSLLGLFYRKADGDWNYFKTTDDQYKIDCSEYNNEDLINSFLGVPCWDSDNEVSSFVDQPTQVIAPNPGDKSSGSGG